MRKILSTVFVLISFAPVLAAQSNTGAIRGIVQDESKTPIPGVRITLTSLETKTTYKVMSRESGEYKFEVPAGTYTLTAELPGFNPVQVSDVRVKEDDSSSMDPVTLTVSTDPSRLPFGGFGGRIPLAPVVKQPPIPL